MLAEAQSPLKRLIKGSVVDPFKPTDVPNILFWVSGDSLAGLSDGDPVATWADKSGNGFDAVQGTSMFRPVYKTGILNSKPVVRFDASSTQFMTAPVGTIAQPYTFFIVTRADNLGATNMYFLDGNTTQNSGILSNAAGTTQYFLFASGGLVAISATNTNWNYLGVVYDGASTLYSVNGVETSPVTSGTASIVDLCIGASGLSAGVHGLYLSGDIAEIIYYTGTVSAPDRALINTYLATKYGL